MTLPRFAVAQCGCMDEEYNYGFDTILSVIIFTARPFPHPTCAGVRGAHKWHQGYNYTYHRALNSYQLFRKPWFDIAIAFNRCTSFWSFHPPYVIGCLISMTAKLSWNITTMRLKPLYASSKCSFRNCFANIFCFIILLGAKITNKYFLRLLLK